MADKPNVRTEYTSSARKGEFDQSDYQWYSKEAKDQHESIFSVVNRIDKDQSWRSSLNIRNARLYSNLEVLGLSIYATGSISNVANNDVTTGRVTYNLVKSCIDTAASKIAKARPKPQFLTSGGDYALREQAKDLTKYIEGVFYSCDYYSVASRAFIDGCVFGTGAIKFYPSKGQIKCERVIPEEIKVDDNDGLYGKPKSMYQTKQLSRSSMVDKYPDYEFAINSAAASTSASSNVDLIQVIEAWHRGPTGSHTICIENATLFSEKWDKDYFPFVFYRWSDRLTGFFGQGLSEELVGTQLEINRTLRNIQLAQKLIAVPRIAINEQSKVSTTQLNNEIGSIIRYNQAGGPPTFHTPTAMNAEVYNHLKWLIQSGYEKTGISMLSATSKKPSGLDSGAALREYSDIESERFMLTSLQYEKLSLEAAKIIIDLSRDMFMEDKTLSVSVPGKEFIETIPWKRVNIKDDEYIMKLFPVGILPDSPAGRLAKIQEMVQAGMIPQEKAIELLDFPDLESYESLETANASLVEKDIYKILETGKYYPPEPQMDLVAAAQTAHKHYLKGRVDDIAPERLELLLRFIDDAERLQKQKEAALAPPAEMVPPMAPAGVAEALPESDLIPNVVIPPIV
tara:strand:- start:1330 stop:3207 length:1878 start_codon:yes stop_codon:yes gene_type:complete